MTTIPDGVLFLMLGNEYAGEVFEMRDGKLHRLSHEQVEAIRHIPNIHRARTAARGTWQRLPVGREVPA